MTFIYNMTEIQKIRKYLDLLDDDVFKEIENLDKDNILSKNFYIKMLSFSGPSRHAFLYHIFANNVEETVDSNNLKMLILNDYYSREEQDN